MTDPFNAQDACVVGYFREEEAPPDAIDTMCDRCKQSVKISQDGQTAKQILEAEGTTTYVMCFLCATITADAAKQRGEINEHVGLRQFMKEHRNDRS